VGGVLPNTRPVDRAARWDGMVPIRFAGGALATVSAADIAETGARIRASRAAAADGHGAGADPYDLVVWAEVADDPAAVPEIAQPYQEAGATWWIESARPGEGWWEGARRRVAAGVTGRTG
jgi:hypothetical protein